MHVWIYHNSVTYFLFFFCVCDNVHIFRGVVRRRWQPLSVDSTCDVKLALEVNHVTVNNEQKSGITITDEMVGAGK